MNACTLRRLAALLVGFALPRAEALTFTGTITGTATHGSLPFFNFYQLGDTWSLGYAYESPTVDGSFSGTAGPGPINPTTGTLRVTLLSGFFIAFDDPLVTTVRPRMTVAGGLVSSFSAGASVFNVVRESWSFDGYGGGSVAYSAPAQATQAVPDAGGAAGWLAGAAGVLAALHRRRETPKLRAVRGG